MEEVAAILVEINEELDAIRKVVENDEGQQRGRIPADAKDLARQAASAESRSLLDLIEQSKSLQNPTVLSCLSHYRCLIQEVLSFLLGLTQKSVVSVRVDDENERKVSEFCTKLECYQTNIRLGVVSFCLAEKTPYYGCSGTRGDANLLPQSCLVASSTSPPSSSSRTPLAGAWIGIDLGTTCSCASVWKDGRAVVIPNEHGNYTTPSCVAFTEDGILVGEDALYQPGANASNTIYDVKRLIGQKFDTIKSDIDGWAFTVDSDKSGLPQFRVELEGSELQTFTAVDLSAFILRKLKDAAEKFLEKPVSRAVVTVPASFSIIQRELTADAARLAGLVPERIVSEPCAAAIAACTVDNPKTDLNVLIFDLGGGTCDVTILTIDENFVFDVISVAGDSRLGGIDFDARLLQLVMTKGEFSCGKESLRQLRTACELARRHLSYSTQAQVTTSANLPGVEISREEFESLCSDLFDRLLDPVERSLKDITSREDADLLEARKKIDKIVLVGGSSQMPKVHSMLSEFFDGKDICLTVNPKHAVAQGAAALAALLSRTENSPLASDGGFLLLDATVASLGVEARGGVMSTMIKRNATFPLKKTVTFSTCTDDQVGVSVKVFQGESTMAKDNIPLGIIHLDGIPPMPKGQPEIDVTFVLDCDGSVLVTVREKSTGTVAQREISRDLGNVWLSGSSPMPSIGPDRMLQPHTQKG